MTRNKKSDRAGLIHRMKHEARYGLAAVRASVATAMEERRKRRLLRAWMKRIAEAPPRVLLGANIDRSRGIRNHLLGIQHHVGHVELAPPDDVREHLTYHDLHTTLRDEFFELSPSRISNIHSHVYPFFIEWCKAHSHKGAQWVHTYHSPYFPIDASTPLESWEKEINNALEDVARHADVRISVSRWQQEWLEAEHGITTVYIPNGVDVLQCERGDAERFRAGGISRQFVLYVGANDAVKNPAAVARLAEVMPETLFVMVGAGLDAVSLPDWWNMKAPPNLLCLGQLTRAQVQDAMAAASALLMTSLWEGLPTVALEAMIHGVPVVVPDNPGCMEAIDSGRFGLWYRQGNLHEMATRTGEAISAGRNPDARSRVLSEFDWRVVAAELDAIYKSGKA